MHGFDLAHFRIYLHIFYKFGDVIDLVEATFRKKMVNRI